jgi:hypothetical protein
MKCIGMEIFGEGDLPFIELTTLPSCLDPAKQQWMLPDNPELTDRLPPCKFLKLHLPSVTRPPRLFFSPSIVEGEHHLSSSVRIRGQRSSRHLGEQTHGSFFPSSTPPYPPSVFSLPSPAPPAPRIRLDRPRQTQRVVSLCRVRTRRPSRRPQSCLRRFSQPGLVLASLHERRGRRRGRGTCWKPQSALSLRRRL